MVLAPGIFLTTVMSVLNCAWYASPRATLDAKPTATLRAQMRNERLLPEYAIHCSTFPPLPLRSRYGPNADVTPRRRLSAEYSIARPRMLWYQFSCLQVLKIGTE